LRRETRTTPIVFVRVADPVSQGFVASLAHPGANVTGFASLEYEMSGKWLALLKGIAPHLVRVALMFNPPDSSLWARFPALVRDCGFILRGEAHWSTDPRSRRDRGHHEHAWFGHRRWPHRPA